MAACCWCDDYDKEISVESEGRYYRRYDSTGTPIPFPMWTKYRLVVPLKSGFSVLVQSRLKMQPNAGITGAEVAQAKANLTNGVTTHWNGALVMIIDDPRCGKKTFAIEYQPQWVDSGEHRVVALHRTWPREYVQQRVMNVGLDTTPKTFAHEFGHATGKPDEYSYKPPFNQQVHYQQVDGTLGPPVIAAPTWPSTVDDSLMGTGDTVRERHGWSVAIETQELLTQKLGRQIRCTIVAGVGF